jgi:hypothetical protein
VRFTPGKLPKANFALVDEVFKETSAISNCLLKILNERTLDVGDAAGPLQPYFGTSNEWSSSGNRQGIGHSSRSFTLRRTVLPIRSQPGRQ